MDVDSPEAADAAVELLMTLGPDPALPDAVARPVLIVRGNQFPDGFAAAANEIATTRNVHFAARAISQSAVSTIKVPELAAASLADAVARRPFRSPAERDLALALIHPNHDPLQVLATARRVFESESHHPHEVPVD